jgi:drug/metabolite transporter (DMT)-like permease
MKNTEELLNSENEKISTNNLNNNKDEKIVHNLEDNVKIKLDSNLIFNTSASNNSNNDSDLNNFNNMIKKHQNLDDDKCCNLNLSKNIRNDYDGKIDIKDNNYSNSQNSSYHKLSTEDISTSIMIDENTSYFDLYKGLFFMFLSCVCKSLFSVLSKILMTYNTEIASLQLLLIKSYILVVFSTLLVIMFYSMNEKKMLSLETNVVVKVILRAVFTVISLSLLIYSLKEISISEVFTVYYTYPGIVLIISVLFLKEKAGKLDYVCLFACTFGVLLIIRPVFVENALDTVFNNNSINKNNVIKNSVILTQNLTHVSTAASNTSGHSVDLSPNKDESVNKNFFLMIVIISAVFKAFEDITIRNIGKQVEPIIFPIVYSFVGMLLYPILVFLLGYNINIFLNLNLISWVLIISIALTHFSMQFLMAKALQNEAACRVSMVNYLQLVFMFMSDMVFFNKQFIIYDIVGTVFIFGFNFGNGFYKFYSRMSKKDRFDNSKSCETISKHLDFTKKKFDNIEIIEESKEETNEDNEKNSLLEPRNFNFGNKTDKINKLNSEGVY